MEELLKNDLEEDLNYKAASVLISAYNKLVKMYYRSEYVKSYSVQRVDLAYKNYKDMQ